MNGLASGLNETVCRVALFFSIAVIFAACSASPVRDVAYDPFAPNVVIRHRQAGSVSFAYRGDAGVISHTTLREDRSKEILVFEQ